MKQAYEGDDRFEQTLENLRVHFDCETKSEVLRKAVALLRLMQNYQQPDGTVILKNKDGRDVQVILS